MDFTKRIGKRKIGDFVDFIKQKSDEIGFRVSSRGWGYILEQAGYITKDQFNKVEDLINRCRKSGLLPVDFVAEESSRQFSEIHIPSEESYEGHVASWLQAALDCEAYYTPDWWKDEEYYVQMVVEKIDLITLFQPICRQYHIPIANAKGWSSILQRAEYARRFKEAEDRGLKCVLLYCGDHDPDGLRISDTILKNLEDVSQIRWNNGEDGFDPSNLEIVRFGLNYDFIIKNKLTWIDNLITGNTQKKMDLGSPTHPNHRLAYVQQYLKKVGRRKCEANSIIVVPDKGKQMCKIAVQEILGEDALGRFAKRRKEVRKKIVEVMDAVDVREAIEEAIRKL